ncbi:hypothetical protein [Bacteroides sp. UBA939]|uniref:hypothetical protein n=1 Tax=Bacteroides sp. UBA939 TaxID=1946092 RepID=UPI0025BF6798|nr:hypothetical protein [Bacteroides sp. UBA939]
MNEIAKVNNLKYHIFQTVSGILSWSQPKCRRYTEITLLEESLDCLSGKPDICWPYGFQYLDDYYKNWDTRTFIDIAKGEFANYIKEKLKVILKGMKEMKERQIELP